MTHSGMMTGFYEARAICHKFQLYTGFTAGRPPLLSVLLTVLHLPIVGICRARKALGVPYGILCISGIYDGRLMVVIQS